MLPDLTVLLGLLIGLGHLDGAPASAGRAVLGSLLCFLVGGALSRMAAGRGLQAVDDGDELAAQASTRWVMLWPFLAWLGALIGFEWGALVNDVVPRVAWIARYLVLLAPMGAMYAIAWSARAEVEVELITRKGGTPSIVGARQAIAAGFKRNAIALAPLFLLLGLVDGVWVLGELGVEPLRQLALWAEAMPHVQIALMMAILGGTLPFLPRLIAKLIGARPMAPGPMREQLERAAAAIDLRYGEIMVWPTKGRVLNAMVVGFTGRSRIIFLTDALLEVLPNEEVMAVFFHEAGHAKKHHLPLFLAMFLGLALLFEELRMPLQMIGLPVELQILLHLALLWFVLLGWVSRRFERESDVYGAEHATVLEGDTEPMRLPGLPVPIPRGSGLMILALKRIETVMGHAGGHRHGTVESRIQFLTHHAVSDEVRTEFRRGMTKLKRGILLLLVGTIALAAWQLPRSLAHAHARVDLLATDAVYERAMKQAYARNPDARDPAAARRGFEDAYAGLLAAYERVRDRDDIVSRNLLVQSLYGAADVAMHGLEDPAKAEAHYRALLAHLDDFDTTAPGAALLRFESHIDLGRIEAWRYAALPVGDPGRDRRAMDRHLATARRLRDHEMGGLPPDRRHKSDKFLAQRARLLAATIDAAIGETALARAELERLARIDATGRDDDWGRFEVAAAARRELAQLPPPSPAPGSPPGEDD